MRVFISVEIPEGAKEKFTSINNLLRRNNLPLKLVRIGNLHLTLKFLGEISEERLKEIIKSCQIIGQQFSPFSLSFKGIGIFPSIKEPRVIWAGVEEGAEGLKKINRLLEEELEKKDFPREEREFQGHLTIARVKRPMIRNEALKDLIRKFEDYQFCSFPVSYFNVMESQLKKEGPIYTCLKEIKLARLKPRTTSGSI
ncbi:MAG: RNA 2',3'-cyclic phosphodiesterase [bacterium (Candidatus Ratteibacteria) CG_4_10_14_3_um_filter_41_18]|uniref:RNA 2',3'-cyclic phosphodiesterase n=2 Tax=Candidatus Ratteibacteria TaxID=2979319 RepID=A0A2M7E913_9BACT|nr:MAG: 2'-5' RNA ligase [Candidatus Omnitrophica bacterium CG1_02_41_171]PIV64171.1 MAG: RNA 2',3'-cyclic phosphodiesterase [bacterium (Candidatus Ratteibacteria) CG01_land_8_20_14_3_00_40_19]PIW74312.1 MAG: RNA 2',3'-cyclic phosphodiesterase [bacterium (Candidatus Ratteibacteria) CG_4_8_14_3_um_filter_41_36]PIX76933.1 MAG: RNA 2',3'-cyclic phosphodiesterase [bacterium (Candidatus Ratteibacteria) CG_4_10_14_3_um_filter_41_18]HCG76477.1 RNA 2',3'-cyclic phosphodiesterase [bacterium]